MLELSPIPNPIRDYAQFAYQICEEERQRDCSATRFRRLLGEMQAHVSKRQAELQRHRDAALTAGRKTGHRQREVERRIVALFDLCIKLLRWEKDSPRLTAKQVRERELSGCWTDDPSGEYLISLINQFYPIWMQVNDLAAAYDGSSQSEAGEGADKARIPNQGAKRNAKSKGRKVETDPKVDERIYDGWKESGCRSFAEYEQVCGRKEREIRLAVDRHEGRLRERQRKAKEE